MTHDDKKASLEAFHRLLTMAQEGGQAKVDSLVALSQRRVFVAKWSANEDDFRTLLNSDQDGALPIFTSEEELRNAAARFRWFSPSGHIEIEEIGARKAFFFIIQHNLSFIVIDIAADHSIEIEREEIEPLLTEKSRRDSQGPFAGVGQVPNEILAVAKPTPHPGSIPPISSAAAKRPSKPTSSSTLPRPSQPPRTSSPSAVTRREIPHSSRPPTKSAFVNKKETQERFEVFPLTQEPTDEFLDSLSSILRDYPEI